MFYVPFLVSSGWIQELVLSNEWQVSQRKSHLLKLHILEYGV